ncbi:transposase [Streptomyces platensis]|uniref:transposase n=1 Tax=Streptomyces platensis TaxID=58346 RepID=UPI0038640EDE
MSKRQAQVWAGIDAGKGHHWAAVVDATGATLWSKKIGNDESATLAALGEILELADEVHWAVDISGTSSALLLALLAAHGRSHPQAEIIESLPGMGPILGAEFVVAAGDLSAYVDAGHLASAAGLVTVPRDSGRRTGNMHRPKRYSRRLRRVFYISAQTSVIREGPNRDFYLKKRGEGCKHVQAVIALARRRASVLWALLRDGRVFTPAPPVTQTA